MRSAWPFFLLLSACGVLDGGEREAPPEPAPEEPPRPSVTGPADDPEIARDPDGASVRMRVPGGRVDIPVVNGFHSTLIAIAEDGTERTLQSLPPGYGDVWCGACGRPPSYGVPSHHPIVALDGVVFAVNGPRPAYPDAALCSDGSGCMMQRALPPGSYQLVVRGNTFECDAVRFRVPITETTEGECRRLDPPAQ